jgi:tetratricopeptide (TPR) repeat protein
MFASLLRRFRNNAPRPAPPAAVADEAWQAGLALWGAGTHDAARAQLERAIALSPRQAPWRNELGRLCMEAGDFAAAGIEFSAALAIDPFLAEAHCNLGIVLAQENALTPPRQAGALAHFSRAAELEPALVAAQYNCGLLLWKMERAGDALPCFDRVLALAPAHAEAWWYRGRALQDLRRFDEAAASLEQALAIKPDYHEVRLTLAFLRLLQGDFAAGWRDYRARYGTAESPVRDFPCPDWDGGALAGRTLLVYAEQGLGDEILFASCLPDLIAQAQHVVVDCEPRLAKLFARSFPQATVHGGRREESRAWLATVRTPDLRIAAGSVPGFLRNSAEEFPARAKYLDADPARVAYWKQRLDALGPGPKIGVAWRGGLPQTRTARRSLPLPALLPVLTLPGTKFVSLQFDAGAEELAALRADDGTRVSFQHWPEAHVDYDETAALVMALDQVLTVCCSIVHLAGALGKTAWVLTPDVPEWRYLAAGNSIPWYQSVRLLRQTRRGEWSDVIVRARDALAAARAAGIPVLPAADGIAVGEAASQRRMLELRVETEPGDAEAHRRLAEHAFDAGDWEAAIDGFTLALHYRPGDTDAMIGYARSLRAGGDAAAAARACREAIDIEPSSLAARLELAAALKALDRGAEAIGEYRSALAVHPGNPGLLCNLGLALHQSGEYTEAAAILRRALVEQPELAEAHHNLGLVLRESGDIEGAIAEFDAAMSVRPQLATRSARAHAVRDAGRVDAALAEYDAILAGHPDFGDALLNRAHALLMRGDFARGWDAYEYRFAAGNVAPRQFALPQWQGGPTAGKGILVAGEQGLGDEIMFASCIPDLIAREGGCVVECNIRLAALFARSFTVPVHGGTKQDADGWLSEFPQLGWQLPAGSLPRIFRRDAAAFARQPRGYLHADPRRVAVWRERYAALGAGSKIGIAWRGGNPQTRGGLRSMELAGLAPLIGVSGVHWVSLQHGDADADIEELRRTCGVGVAAWPGTGADIDELAAMIVALDRVVTIDNTTAHLAGALGVPVWILLARGADWRYGTGDMHMPWYPNAQLFRQRAFAPGWAAVVAAAAAALRDETGNGKARP